MPVMPLTCVSYYYITANTYAPGNLILNRPARPRYLVEHRRRLVDDRTRISNRMTALLKLYDETQSAPSACGGDE